VARGVRLNDLLRRRPQIAERGFASTKAKGFDWAVAKLHEPAPSLLERASVRAVGLLEVWTHHEDVRRRSAIPRGEHPDLTEVIASLQRYHRIDDLPNGPQHEVAYWLAGRDGGPRPV
jgi:hypothetical protein